MPKPNENKPFVESTAESNIYDTYIRGKEFYYLLGILLLACYFVFGDYISLKKVFLFTDIGSDTVNSYFPILVDNSNYAKAQSEIGWTFTQGMGQNIFPGFYGDMFFYFLTTWDKANIAYGLAFMEVLKIILIGLVFYHFLKEVKVSGFSSLLFSILIAFCGFVIVGGTWLYFSTEAVYVSIILYGFERWLNHGKMFFLVLGITLLALMQPFLLYVYTLLISAYAIVRYHDVKEKNGKQFILFVLKTVCIAAMAVFISSYQLFANLLQMIESPRVAGEASFFSKLSDKSMFDFADATLRFTTTFRAFGSDMLGTGNNFKGWQNYLEAPDFYCGILCLVAFPQFFGFLTKRQKYFYGTITVLFCLPILFPFFRYGFWAFLGDYFRAFSFVIVLFMVMFSARAVSFIDQKNKINKVVLACTVLFLLFLLYTPAAQFKGAINTNLRTVVTLLIFVYAGLLMALSQASAFKNISKLLIIIICVIEVVSFSSISVNKRDVITKKQLSQKVGYNDYSVEAIDYLKKADQSFYRVNKDYSSGPAIHSSINDSKVQGYYGTSSYFSFNQKNYIKFLGDLSVIDVKDENSTRWAKGLIDRPVLFSLASGKYWLSKRTDNAVAAMGYDSIAAFGDVKVYKNRYTLPLGFAYKQTIGEDEFKKLSPSQKDFCILRACVIDKEDPSFAAQLPKFNLADTLAPLDFVNYEKYTTELKKETFAVSKFTENHIAGSITTPEPAILFFSIPFDKGWKATVNGKDVELTMLNCGLTGLMTEKGLNTVELKFVPRYKKTGAYITLISLALFIGLTVLLYLKSRSKKNSTA